MHTTTLLEELVSVDSSTKENANKLVDILSVYLEENGVKGRIIENKGYKSYVALIGEGDRTVVLNGHLDVVPGNPEQFQPFKKDGKLYGRGTADMKAGCIAIINAMIELSKEELPCKVMLQLVTDEETGGFNCTKYLVDEGYTGDFVICTEPTNLDIGIQAKGFLRIDIEIEGIPAHASRPWQGENAIIKAMKNYEKVVNLSIFKIGSEIYESSTVNLSFIEGGDIYNKVPDRTIMGLDVRFIPSLDPYDIVDEIDRVVEGKVLLKALGEAINNSVENPYIKDFIEIANKSIGSESIKLLGQHGSSDGRFFSSLGIPTIEFGPAGCDWHGDHEYVEIESIYQVENIIKEFIRRF